MVAVIVGAGVGVGAVVVGVDMVIMMDSLVLMMMIMMTMGEVGVMVDTQLMMLLHWLNQPLPLPWVTMVVRGVYMIMVARTTTMTMMVYDCYSRAYDCRCHLLCMIAQ